MTILRRNLFRLWIAVSIVWLAFVLWLAYHHLASQDAVGAVVGFAAIGFGPLIFLLLVGAGFAQAWEWFEETHWSRLPEHLRRGLVRLYLAVTLPWVAWFLYQIVGTIDRNHYWQWRHISHAFWSLIAVPVGGPLLLLIIYWVSAGFRQTVKPSFVRDTNASSRATSTPTEVKAVFKGAVASCVGIG